MASVLLLVKLTGKKRLSHLYTEELRQKLIFFLFERMLKVLKGLTVYVATPDNFRGNGYEVIRDEWEDINRVITKARGMIKDDMLILPCDLPFVEREDVEGLLSGRITVVPSQNGGTNALFLPRDMDFETQFGESSFEKHIALLEKKSIAYEIYESDHFRDIDTEEDIAWALEHRRNSEFSRFVVEELASNR
ncbi:MAG: hypothetical protein HXS48_12870 [Theionarchaea archaeon]|nr:hypothetical protein [Theionarchaea archaeon]